MQISMELRFTIPPAEADALGRKVELALERVRSDIQAAAAMAFYDITMNNFGDTGIDRPHSWAALSPSYARKVKRNHATLVVSGALRDSVRLDIAPDAASVQVDDTSVPYARVHQTGGGNNIPARPFMPLTDAGEPTWFAREEMLAAAHEELARALA